MGDALASAGDEGRGKLRKAIGSRKQALIYGYPNGTTPQRATFETTVYSRANPGN